jgi:hypothetical protein
MQKTIFLYFQYKEMKISLWLGVNHNKWNDTLEINSSLKYAR